MTNTSPAQHEAIVRWLATAQAYPHRPERVEQIETHISHVFLAGSHVYKLKKPVKYDFLDYTTLENRERACREEVRLNRRLAPDAYLGVVPISAPSEGGFQLDGAGKVVDWLVHMRRLPTELTLDALHRRGELKSHHIDRLADTLVRFYQSLSPLQVTSEGYRQRCLSHVRSNQQELLAVKHHLPRGVVERIHGFQLQLLTLQPELLEERVQAGRVIDGHGDLRPEHICLSDPIQIFDCIEFSSDFRTIDIVDELAFLSEECDFLGAEWVGPQLLAAYQHRSGDDPPPILFGFYKSYRACVRAKVAALRADQLAGEPQQAAATEATKHLRLADRYVERWLSPIVIGVGGLSGTGKSTLAKALAAALGGELLRTDVIRQELHGAGSNVSAPNIGIYSQDERHAVYDEMLHRATEIHRQRISLVLDGTFSTREPLLKAAQLASQPQTSSLIVECTCRPEVAQQRITHRLSDSRDASQAHPEIHDFQRNTWESWPAELPSRRIDTEQPLDKQVAAVIAALAASHAD